MAGDGEVLQHPGDALVKGGEAIPTGFLGQGAGEVTLAGTGGSGHQDVAVPSACGSGPGT